MNTPTIEQCKELAERVMALSLSGASWAHVFHSNERAVVRVVQVENLGWLLRHAREVTHLAIIEQPKGEAVLLAYLPGKVYGTRFADITICRRWIARPCLAHADLIA